ncbi:MAG: hypothetical protein KF906_08260 [Actinobacteria bacterium]|nr:hypothetical protein [Actinomycetota bacterium]
MALAVLGLVIGVVACGSSSEGRSPIEPIDTTIPEDASAARFPKDQIVWQVHTAGGLVPEVSWAAQRPTLTIYGDGRAFIVAPGLDRRYDQPIELRSGTVARDDLAVFVAQAEASGLFEPDVDLGTPDVTDMATTTVVLHGGGDPQSVSAYALGGRFDADLSDDLVRRRETLRRLLSSAEALVDEPEAWTPSRVRVLRLADDATYEAKPDADPDAEPPEWSGPDLDAFGALASGSDGSETVLGCTEVDGSAAGDLFDAAKDNPLPRWKVGGIERTIVVVALLPDEPACDLG